MRQFLTAFATPIAFLAFASAVQAETGELGVTVTYRERIAIAPGAQLEVQLLDVSRAQAEATRIASQRFAMTSVPMTIVLPYDPQVISDGARYAVVAELWSGDDRLFETRQPHAVFESAEPDVVQIVLSMVTDEHAEPPNLIPISGIEWAVTDIRGEPWGNDDPATLLIDDAMNFGMFGGCNRFSGRLVLSGTDISFPQDFAGTLMACAPETEQLERRFLEALQSVSRYMRSEAGLVLMDGSGQALLRFIERPD